MSEVEIKKKATVLLYLNFPDNNQHGCKFGCQFCQWHALNYNKKLCPSNEAIIKFVNRHPEATRIQLTGGGDPLFNYKQNRLEIIRILNLIKSLGKTCEIITHEYDVVDKYLDTDFKDVNDFAFSIETQSEYIRNILKRVKAAGKHVRISKLYFPDSQQVVNYQEIDNYIHFYQDVLGNDFKILLRDHYKYPLSAERLQQEKSYIQEKYSDRNVRLHGAIVYLFGLIDTYELYCCQVLDYLDAWSNQTLAMWESRRVI